MTSPGDQRRKGDRMRQTILEWVFPLAGTVGLLAAFILALFAK